VSDDGPDVSGDTGTTRIRPRGTFDAKQGIPYFLGVSGGTAGAKGPVPEVVLYEGPR